MCPSYRVTRQERDVTRGRANSLRLAITGQLGPDALTSEEMAETLKLCVSCKGCRRECPTGVDMARMKIEVAAARAEKYGLSLHDKLVGWLPRYAPYAARVSWLLNLRDALPGAAKLSEVVAGFSARRSLPRWRPDIFDDNPTASLPGIAVRRTASLRSPMTRQSIALREKMDAQVEPGHVEPEVVLFADTFNRYFERENLDAAMAVLNAGGYRVRLAKPADGSSRPLCCGRTFLSIGKVDEARKEANRTLTALASYVERGVPIIGLEPSCLLSFRDEIPAMAKNDLAAEAADLAVTFEEFLAREMKDGRLNLPLKRIADRALVHGHCHQKAFDAFTPVETVLKFIPDLKVESIESSCCGMAGSFGYAVDTIDASKAMGELSLLPAVRRVDAETLIVADGTSCRHQIHDGTGRDAIHVARVLAMSLDEVLSGSWRRASG
jgi:Fe-S oxidoreductase